MAIAAAGDGSYEWLRERLALIAPAARDSERELLWVDAQRRLAVARDAKGRVEVFIVGPALFANTRIVRDSVEHQSWTTSKGHELAATRVVLPPMPHYDGVAAFLCTELLSNGVQDEPQRSFDLTEPVLAMALARTQLTDQVLMGLVGELALLDSLLRRCSRSEVETVLESWAGSSPSSRDFQLGSVGIEVKTTTALSSTHHVQGTHQVEIGHSNTGAPESLLFLLSLGVNWIVDEEGGTTLPRLVDSILAKVEDEQAREGFVARVKQYGGDAAIGYDHVRDRERPRYLQRFSFRFERLYDMTDPRIMVLRSPQVVGLSDIEPSSITFKIRLRDQVRGELNPVTGWHALTGAILNAVGLD
jgi:hypothetical protein